MRVGCAADWISTGLLGPIDLIILDHRGELYHTDLHAVESSLSHGARVFADNVLHPGAPLLLAHIQGRYDVAVHEVPEFAHVPPLHDWVAVCASGVGHRPSPKPAQPELRRWAAEVDTLCQQSRNRQVDWLGFQQRLRPALWAWWARPCSASSA